MNRLLVSLPVLCAAAAFVMGCTVSEKQWDTDVAALRANEWERRDNYAWCVSNVADKPVKSKKAAARELKIPIERVPPILCRRLLNGMVSGRITYQDYQNIERAVAKLKS